MRTLNNIVPPANATPISLSRLFQPVLRAFKVFDRACRLTWSIEAEFPNVHPDIKKKVMCPDDR